MTDVSIRPARADDFDAIAAITNHYITSTAIHFGDTPETADGMRALWRDGQARYPWFVAHDHDGAVIGYAKDAAYRTRAAYAWITEAGLYLAPDRRGGGVGTALYTALLGELRARGFRSVIGGIALPNPRSVALHERLGFTSVGVVKGAGWKFGAWHDVGFWQLALTDDGGPPGAPPGS
ncbi:MAG: GNAT family N-acetyltransferase [Deltaproteobacteria bacterium]|nr:GNAT family N-acetyltransferase [Deltaproteobacteria bacterium]